MSSLIVQMSRLPWMVGSKELSAYCSMFGTIRNVYVPVDCSSGFTHRVAWVHFANAEGKKRFIDRPVHIIEGYVVRVKQSVKPE